MSIRLLVRDVFASPALFSRSDSWFLSPDVCGGVPLMKTSVVGSYGMNDLCLWNVFWVNCFVGSF